MIHLFCKEDNSVNSKYIRIFIGCILLLCFVSTTYSSGSQKSVQDIYQKAKERCIAQEWERAINLYQQLIDEYPDSKFTDDAQFWIGYCLEKRDGSEIEAFMTFETLIDEYSGSPWVDDALVHQISVAEKLVETGKRQFLTFLIEKIQVEDTIIKQQAALALGRLGDRRALPILQDMKDHEDLGQLAQYLIEKLKSEPPKKTPLYAASSGADIRFDIEGRRIIKKVDKVPEKASPFFFYTKRHKQYKDMLKDSDQWTKDELIDFGMWYILSTDEYEEFRSLIGYDRSEWLRKYWKGHDPTPTTEINEAKIEFEQRVHYANSNFSELWDYRQAQFLKDQYLRGGMERAPWDARGEIYIKYGAPDSRIAKTDFKDDFKSVEDYTDSWPYKEEWIYDRYNVDFTINKYMTNIYGNAIKPGEGSQFIYENTPLHVDANFINHPEFRYEHDYHAKELKKLKLTIDQKSVSEGPNIHIHYEVPTKEFKLTKEDDIYRLRYLQRLVVFDEDLREVYRDEKTQYLTEENKKAFKKIKNFKETIPLTLQPGDYTAVLRIEDEYSDKLGIYIEDLEIEK